MTTTITKYSTYTPGPWRLEGPWDRRLIEHLYTDGDGNAHSGNICVVDGKRGEQNEANARLIAAAPELREYLVWAVTQLAKSNRLSGQDLAVIEKSRAILARIDGVAR